MPDPHEPISDEAQRQSATAILDNRIQTLWAMANSDVIPARINRRQAWAMTQHVLGEFETLQTRAVWKKEYAPDRVAVIEDALSQVQDDAMALAMAELRRESAQATTQMPPVEELQRKVRKYDSKLMVWALALSDDDEGNDEAIIADIRSGRGSRDDAEDVIRLATLLRPKVAQITGQSALTQEQLAAAEADATTLLSSLNAAKASKERTPQDLVNRAYTVWHRHYMILIRTGRDQTFEDQPERRFPKPSPTWGLKRSTASSSNEDTSTDDA
ncbi:MAG: hypothetical protein AAFX99_00550 [Myxococcota bacterium]